MPICLVNHARWWMIWSESIAPTKTRQYLVLVGGMLSDQIILAPFLQRKLTPRCEFLLNEGCKVNHFDTGSESPIFYFERNGQSWCRKHWCGVPQMCRSLEQPRLMQRKSSPLHESGLLQTLIQHHADLDVIDKPGLSPFSEEPAFNWLILELLASLALSRHCVLRRRETQEVPFFLEWVEASNELRFFWKNEIYTKGNFWRVA